MYSTVKEYLEAEYPHLVTMLDNGGAFWPTVKDNTISNTKLVAYSAILDEYSFVNQACEALKNGRLLGKINNPG